MYLIISKYVASENAYILVLDGVRPVDTTVLCDPVLAYDH